MRSVYVALLAIVLALGAMLTDVSAQCVGWLLYTYDDADNLHRVHHGRRPVI